MHFRRPSPGTAIALLALFFAMGGTAIAAHHYLITKTSQIKPSVLKALKGNAGPAGVAGKEGSPGKEGKEGKEGLAGKEGKQGPPGPVNLSKLTEVRTETPIKVKEEEGFADAFCPEGMTAISGGYFVTGPGLLGQRSEAFNFFIFGFHITGWSVSGTNIAGEVELEAIAYCAPEGAAVQASRLSPSKRRLAEQEVTAKLKQRAVARTR